MWFWIQLCLPFGEIQYSDAIQPPIFVTSHSGHENGKMKSRLLSQSHPFCDCNSDRCNSVVTNFATKIKLIGVYPQRFCAVYSNVTFLREESAYIFGCQHQFEIICNLSGSDSISLSNKCLFFATEPINAIAHANDLCLWVLCLWLLDLLLWMFAVNSTVLTATQS